MQNSLFNNYQKSPLNYIGNKYRIIGKIEPLFPKNIRVFVDLFCGGLDVSINTQAEQIVSNDLNKFLIDAYIRLKEVSYEELCEYVESTVLKYNMSKTDPNGFLRLREHYNQFREPMELIVLIMHSFNYQFRLNSKNNFNMSWGSYQCFFTESIRKNYRGFLKRIQNIVFQKRHFSHFNFDVLTYRDFVYCDPPYILTTGSYNDNKRGFLSWSEENEIELYNLLGKIGNNTKIGISNVLEHRGKTNKYLQKAIIENNWNIHDIDFNYNNCNYQNKTNKKHKTREVLITNY